MSSGHRLIDPDGRPPPAKRLKSSVPHGGVGASEHEGPVRRLHRNLLCGSLWHSECRALEKGLTMQVPTSFENAAQYVAIFEPLLHDEAREGMKKEFQESQEARRGWSVHIDSIVGHAGGWYKVQVSPVHMHGMGLREGSVVVLTATAPASMAECRPGGRSQTLRVSGILTTSSRGVHAPISLDIHPACGHHDPHQADSPCTQILPWLEPPPFPSPSPDPSSPPPRTPLIWTLIPAGSVTTHMREITTLHRAAYLPLLQPLLSPYRELAQASNGLLANLWPADCGSEPFIRHLQQTYEQPQLQAITAAASHMALEDQRKESEIPVLPITLIQGPPGTGKTHTVVGILNAWHMVQFHRHQGAWLALATQQLDPRRRGAAGITYSANGFPTLRTVQSLAELQDPLDHPKPRILVCAPSNAATDELLERILSKRFVDFGGGEYSPNVVRVGAEEAPLSEAVKAVWTDARIERYLAMQPREWAEALQNVENDMAQCDMFLGQLVMRAGGDVAQKAMEVVSLRDRYNRSARELKRLETIGGRFQPGAKPNERMMREELEISLVDDAEIVFTTLSSTGRKIFSRLIRGFDTVLIDEAAQATEIATLQPLVYGAAKVVMVGDPQQLPATVFSNAARDVQLSRSLFERLQQAGAPVALLSVQYRMHPEIRTFPSAFFYENQLIDGASVLARTDPSFYEDDLLKPYVVFDVPSGRESSRSKSRCNVAEAQLALGLFMQLRAHLVMALKAAAAASEPAPPPVCVGIITPYKAQRDLIRSLLVQALGSVVAAEVQVETVDSFQGKQLDVAIFSCVRSNGVSINGHLKGPSKASNGAASGGVGGSSLATATATTAVQAGLMQSSGHGAGGGGVGFLADTRRMNVAITRAKHAMWILGHRATLRQQPTWQALFDNAEERGCLIEDALASELCPLFAQWEAQQSELLAQRGPGEGAAGGGRGQHHGQQHVDSRTPASHGSPRRGRGRGRGGPAQHVQDPLAAQHVLARLQRQPSQVHQAPDQQQQQKLAVMRELSAGLDDGPSQSHVEQRQPAPRHQKQPGGQQPNFHHQQLQQSQPQLEHMRQQVFQGSQHQSHQQQGQQFLSGRSANIVQHPQHGRGRGGRTGYSGRGRGRSRGGIGGHTSATQQRQDDLGGGGAAH